MAAISNAVANYMQMLRRLSREAWLFMASVVASGVCYIGLHFLLINLYLLRLGYSVEFVGIFVSVGAFSFSFFSFLVGFIGRRWGSRRPMIFGLIVLALSLAMLALTVFVPVGWRTIWLISFCILREFGNAFYLVNSNPYLMQITDPSVRSYAFSVRAALTPLAGFCGTLLGGWLIGVSTFLFGWSSADPSNYVMPLLLASVLLLPGLVALCLTREIVMVTAAKKTVERGPLPLAMLVNIALVSLLFIFAAAAGQSFYNVYMDGVLKISTQHLSSIVSCGHLCSGLILLIVPVLMKRWGQARTFMWAACGMGLSLLPMALLPHWLAAGLSIVGVITLMAIASMALTIFHQELVPPGWRPAMSGCFLMGMGMGWGIVASGGGYFVTHWGWAPFFLVAMTITLIGVAVFWRQFIWGRY